MAPSRPRDFQHCSEDTDTAGRLDDQPVERDVVPRQRSDVPAWRPPHLLYLAFERRDVAAEASCGLPRGELLERRPHEVDLDKLLRHRMHAYPRTAKRLGLDEP